MHEEPQQKTGLQHTTVVWYGDSCANKYYKLAYKYSDTSAE